MIDTHCHLYLCEKPLNKLIENAQKTGLIGVINIGINNKTSLSAIQQSTLFPDFIFSTVGIHPCECHLDTDYDAIKSLTKHQNVVAIGEIGLDYYHMNASRNSQIKAFETQLELAEELGLPVVIHNRKADDDIKSILKTIPHQKKVLHCFSSSLDFAESILTPSTYFSFTGSITYSKKGKTLNAVRHIPLPQIMIETDSPYLTPKEQQGIKNEPAFVTYIGKKIAMLKGLPEQVIQEQLTKNAKTFFSLNI